MPIGYTIAPKFVSSQVLTALDAVFVTDDEVPKSLSQLIEDSTHRLVTDTEKSTWNGKQDALGFTPENIINKKTTLTDSDDNYPTTKAINTALSNYLKIDQTTPQTAVGTFTFPKVVGTTDITTPLLVGGSSTTQDLTFKTTSGVGTTGADMHFLVGNNGGTEAMTILNNGYVGIGTTAPYSLLQVAGSSPIITIRNTATATVGNYSALLFQNTMTDGSQQFSSVIRGIQQGATVNTGDLAIVTYNGGVPGEVARFTSGGNVGIGTTDLDGTPAVGKLTIKGTTNNGTSNILVGRDSDEVNVFLVDTDGAITSASLTSGKIPVATTGGKLIDITAQTELTDELTTLTYIAPITPDYTIQDFTQTAPFGFVTADEANTVLSVIVNLQTRVNELETKLVALGLLADAD
jgi:hypothetical protein